MIEYSAPNTNKPQHLGHVLNVLVTLSANLAHVGHTVTRVNLINDRGIHICKSMLAYQRLGEGYSGEHGGKDHFVGDFYVPSKRRFPRNIPRGWSRRPRKNTKHG